MTKLLTKRDVAAALGVDIRTVERLRIPRVALPGTGRKPIVRYDAEAVEAFVSSYSSKKKIKRAG